MPGKWLLRCLSRPPRELPARRRDVDVVTFQDRMNHPDSNHAGPRPCVKLRTVLMCVEKMMSEPSATAPGFAQLLSNAQALETLIAEQIDVAEAERHMTDSVYAAIANAQLWHMLTPAELGGSELSFSDAMVVTEKVASFDGSTGWCLMVGGVQHGSCGSLIAPGGSDEVFARGTATHIAGQGIPRGLARKVDGGYMIRGDWSYGSGIYHANWIHSGCVVMDGERPLLDEHGAPTIIITYVPRNVIELKDNWDVIGLRGTGSYDYSIADEIFVADDLTYVYSKNSVERGGRQYALGIVGFTAWGHTSFALGVGRRALDEVAAIARAKTGPFGVLADAAGFQEKYAHAEAQYRSVRAFVYQAWNDIDETVLREQPVTLEQVTLVKLAFRHAHDVMSDICTFAYKNGGGVALRPSALQRCYRDMHAGVQHVLLSDQIMQDCGRVLMGHVPAGARMELLGLH